jgi:hypothetical protein
MPIYLATVSAVFVCILKTRNNVKYVNQLFHEHVFKNWLFEYCQYISIIVHACSLTKNKVNACITYCQLSTDTHIICNHQGTAGTIINKQVQSLCSPLYRARNLVHNSITSLEL